MIFWNMNWCELYYATRTRGRSQYVTLQCRSGEACDQCSLDKFCQLYVLSLGSGRISCTFFHVLEGAMAWILKNMTIVVCTMRGSNVVGALRLLIRWIPTNIYITHFETPCITCVPDQQKSKVNITENNLVGGMCCLSAAYFIEFVLFSADRCNCSARLGYCHVVCRRCQCPRFVTKRLKLRSRGFDWKVYQCLNFCIVSLMTEVDKDPLIGGQTRVGWFRIRRDISWKLW